MGNRERSRKWDEQSFIFQCRLVAHAAATQRDKDLHKGMSEGKVPTLSLGELLNRLSSVAQQIVLAELDELG